MNETSQYYSKEPAGGNSIIDSSQFKSSQNFQMDCNYLFGREEQKPLPCRPDSGFPCTERHIGWPYQYARHDSSLRISDDVTNAGFKLNSFEKPDSGGKCATPTESSVSRPQVVKPKGTAMSGNIGQPLLDMNLGMTQFNPNEAGAEPLLTPGKLGERFMPVNVGSGSNRESKPNAIIPKANVTCNSERVFLPPINTYHNQLDSRSLLNPGLDMNGGFSGFQNDSRVMSGVAHTGDDEVLLGSRTGLHLGPSHGFQRPSVGDQNHYLRQININRDLALFGAKNIGMEFADVGHRNRFERSIVVPSFPSVHSQTMPCESRHSRVSTQLVPSSTGMVTDQSPFELLPENNGKFSSQSFAHPPLVMATRSTRRKDPSSNNGQSQVVGSIQPSNPRLGQHSASGQGTQTGKGNTSVQVSRPSIRPSLKRAASQPMPSTVQDQRRKILQTQPLPSIPTWTRLAPPAPNTPQPIPPPVHAGAVQSRAPRATQSFVSPLLPTLPAPNTTQTIPPLTPSALSLPSIDKRVSSSQRSSHPLPLPNQLLIAQSLARKRLRTPLIPPAPHITSNYIKYKDQTTPEPIGYKCLLCKRDLSYAPEGPMSQPPIPPTAAVLSCGHTFHEHCLEQMTLDSQSSDPPCIPCALCE